MSVQRVLALVLGGGRGTRLYPLTRDRSKPAVPLAGKYRIIDVPLSNCINSGVQRIYVLTQFNSSTAISAALTHSIRSAADLSKFSPPSRRSTVPAGIRAPPTRSGRTSAICSSQISATC